MSAKHAPNKYEFKKPSSSNNTMLDVWVVRF